MFDGTRYRVRNSELTHEINIDMLLLLILDRDSLCQDIVDEPLQVHFAWSDDLLKVLELGLKIILACIITDEFDSLLIILGR